MVVSVGSDGSNSDTKLKLNCDKTQKLKLRPKTKFLLLIRLFSCICHTAHHSKLATRGCKKHPLGEKATNNLDFGRRSFVTQHALDLPSLNLNTNWPIQSTFSNTPTQHTG